MPKISVSALAPAFLAAFLSASCGGGGEPRDGAVDYDFVEIEAPAGFATMTPNNAFEGTSWFVADISTSEPGADFSGAQVFVPEGMTSLHIVQQRCNRARCGVVLSIDEYMDSTAQPVPRPIDADSVQLRIETSSGCWAATLTIFPLEISRSASASYPLRLSGTYMVSELTLSGGAQLLSNFADLANLGKVSRLFVSGPVVIEGTVDFGGQAASGSQGGLGGPGGGKGGTGGAPPSAAEGRGPGHPGEGDGGGGGGGHGEAGRAGTDGSGTGGLGGAAYGDDGLECARSDSSMCGGSGGGQACDGGGGGGGGAFFLLSLDSITFIDAVMKADGGPGGDGTCGGGGGAGGSLVLAAPVITGNVAMSADGSEGGAGSTGGSGGEGGKGRIRIDGNMSGALISAPQGFYTGPAVDTSGLELIDADTVAAIRGTCMPGAEVLVNNVSMGGSGQVTVTCAGDGTFAADVPLVPGANDVALSQQVEGGAPAFGQVGNTFDLGGALPRGSRLIIESVPDVE